jgi:hypothetical protein
MKALVLAFFSSAYAERRSSRRVLMSQLAGLLLTIAFLLSSSAVAHASTYVYDFHFDPLAFNGQTYAATDIFYTTGSILDPALTYLSGSINGYAPATLPTAGSNYIFVTSSFDQPVGTVQGVAFYAPFPLSGPGFYFTNSAGRGISFPAFPPTTTETLFEYSTGSLTITAAAATPEPDSIWLLVSGALAGTGLFSCRIRSAAQPGPAA